MRKQLKSIICATDFSDYSNYTLPYGLALARAFEAKLYVCHVIDLPSAQMYGETVLYTQEQEKRMKDYAREEMDRLIGRQPVPWEPLIVIGQPASEIAKVAGEKHSDLVITATHGRSGLSRLILGSVTERLMRTLPCPLLITRGLKHDRLNEGGEERIKFKRLLVGYDFSPYSSLALEYALSLAQEFEAELHLTHVIEPPVYKDLVKAEKRREERGGEDLRGHLKRELEQMIPEETHVWCTPKVSLLAGEPHEEITKYALVQDIDLIVLGVHGRGLVEDLFIGSTTDRVAREAPCPVLSIRPVG